MEIHGATHFMHDGALCHKTKVVTKMLADKGIRVLEWPGNSPDLNPIENVWGYMKRKLKPTDITSVPKLTKVIQEIWTRELTPTCFKDLSSSMPKRIRGRHAEILNINGKTYKLQY